MLTRHGHSRSDENAWLMTREDPAVIEWLKRENARTEDAFGPIRSLKATLASEIRSRIVPTESSVPAKDGPFLYFHRYEPGAEYPRYLRKHLHGGREELLLDADTLGADHDYFDLAAFEISPDHRQGAFAVDTVGDRTYCVRFIDFESSCVRVDTIDEVTDDLAFAADSETLFFAKHDPKTQRFERICRYRPGQGAPETVYVETDEAYWVGVERSLSGRVLFLTSAATLSTEVWYLPAATPEAAPSCFLARRAGHEYYVCDGCDRFYVLSNRGAPNFGVYECPLSDTSEDAWEAVIPPRDDVLIHELEVFETVLVLTVSAAGQDRIEIVDRVSGSVRDVPIDEAVCSAAPVDNFEYSATTLRYGVESFAVPERVLDFDLLSGQRTLLREEPVPGFDASLYRSERRQLEARDGARVPVSLVYRKDLEPGAETPLLIEAYGAYGAASEALFDLCLPCLLDRGFVYAVAHVRGGSELGRDWYEAGRRRTKMNSFLDFIDVTRGLQAAGLSSPGHCYATGGSAGGLLVAGVANLAPGLYNGIFARVPFTDVVSTMLDPEVPLTTGEYDEWGDPRERGDYFYMLGYSPYDNVRPQAYPHILATASLNDSQVQYWDPAKWVARLRERRTNDNLLLLETALDAGHGGHTGRYRSLDDSTLELGFYLMLERRAVA